MNAAALLGALRRSDVRAWCEGERLELEAPPGVLRPRLLEVVRSYKAELLQLLELESASRATPHEYSCAATVEGFSPRAVYDSGAAAAHAWREFEGGKIDEGQRDALLSYAMQASEVRNGA